MNGFQPSPETSNLILSSELFYRSALVIALLDGALILLLAWRIKPARFQALKWPLAGSAALIWSLFGVVLVRVFWDSYYRYFYPAGLRSGGILLFVPLAYGLLALIYHALAIRLPGNPILVFCLLGGFGSILEHVWGFNGLGVLEVPMLQEASPISILVFAFPEYILYWCVVIGLAALAQGAWRWLVRFRSIKRTTEDVS